MGGARRLRRIAGSQQPSSASSSSGNTQSILVEARHQTLCRCLGVGGSCDAMLPPYPQGWLSRAAWCPAVSQGSACAEAPRYASRHPSTLSPPASLQAPEAATNPGAAAPPMRSIPLAAVSSTNPLLCDLLWEAAGQEEVWELAAAWRGAGQALPLAEASPCLLVSCLSPWFHPAGLPVCLPTSLPAVSVVSPLGVLRSSSVILWC
ncbi:hypothetical protein ABPG75_009388 [Micractinium tetrahymenae]